MVVGDDRKYLLLLVTLKTAMVGPTADPTSELTPECIDFIKTTLNQEVSTVEEAMGNDHVNKFVQSCVDETNKFSISRAAQVRKFLIMPAEFTIVGGEMTPTMKLKRKFVLNKYKDLIER